ncbi:MAG TPA: class I SAM-dependent methyltransferase [Segetibacter sp.]|nr:class I SAM-dependent methyltransferase [Segetibacter sp.]
MTGIVEKLFHKKPQPLLQKEPEEGYNLWAKNYDKQPGNLMLDFDEQVFTVLLDKVGVKDKTVADIGCGTGRHWSKIFNRNPASLHGFDVSAGMLLKLKEKFPKAETSLIKDDRFQNVEDGSFDVIISTLTIAHIKNIEQAIQAWARILKPAGELIITDFHPVALASGGKRTFKNKDEVISITNYIHSIGRIKEICFSCGMTTVAEEERVIDEAVKHYYQRQGAMHIYNQFKGVPMLYGIYLKRINGLK